MGGNRAHIQRSKQIGGVCGAGNLGKATVSWICPEKLGKRKGRASVDIEGLSAAPSPLVKLELITDFSEAS